jgi:hypothetical protein
MNQMVEAGGVGLYGLTDNTQLTENPRRSIRTILGIHAFLVRRLYTEFSRFLFASCAFVLLRWPKRVLSYMMPLIESNGRNPVRPSISYSPTYTRKSAHQYKQESTTSFWRDCELSLWLSTSAEHG